MKSGTNRSVRRFARGAAGVIALLALWETFARCGLYSQAVTPPLGKVLYALGAMLADGTLVGHLGATLARVMTGMAIAFALALPLGMLMGRSKSCERMLLPPVTVLMPIPSLAWVPLIVLWFGIGDAGTVLVVVYAASFPLLYNVWTGVRTVTPIWLRAAQAMGAGQGALFAKVIWPATLPHAIIGLRLAFGRAWIAVIGGELLASPEWGLGKLIFDAKEYLNAEVMLAALLAIGAVGVLFERVVFETLEDHTVAKWGMTSAPAES